jgi:hypothetical protein
MLALQRGIPGDFVELLQPTRSECLIDALREAYYEVARDEAQVVNYLAQSITLNKDKKY